MKKIKVIKTITAEELHELVLNLPLDEYYKLFQLMFNHVTNFIYEAEKLANKYIEEKNNPPYKIEKKK